MLLYKFRVNSRCVAQWPCRPLYYPVLICEKQLYQLIKAALIAADIGYNAVALRF